MASEVVERLAKRHQQAWTMGSVLTTEASERQAAWFMLAIADEMDMELKNQYRGGHRLTAWLRAQAGEE